MQGNISRFDQPEGVFGLTVDQTKAKANLIMRRLGLPDFDQEARVTRADITTNLAAGENRRQALRWVQTLELGRREKVIRGLNTQFGQNNDWRSLRIYDKAKQIREQLMRGLKGAQKSQMQTLADYCEQNGLIRLESEMRSRYLRDSNVRSWDNATHENLLNEFNQEVQFMQEIEVDDLDKIPMPYAGTLAMFLTGMNPKDRMHPKTFAKHKKVLSGHGYDISTNNIVPLRAQKHVIVLEALEPPDWYEMPTVELKSPPLKSVD